jgi:hypothetical protein
MKTSNCPSDYRLDLYWLDLQKDKAESNQDSAHINACPACQERLGQIEEAKKVFQRDIFPQSLPEISSPKRTTNWFRILCLSAVPACLVIFFSLKVFLLDDQAPEPTLKVKGNLALQVWCQRHGQVFRLGQGEALVAGDLLRLRLQLPNDGFLMILADFGQAQPQIWYPLNKVSAGTWTSPESVRFEALDEKLDLLMLRAVFSKTAFKLTDVECILGDTPGQDCKELSMTSLEFKVEQRQDKGPRQ